MSNHSYQHLIFETDENGIATLTINRPDKLNALNSGLIDELEKAVKTVETSDDVRGLIITGSGEKAFVAGADIAELQKLNRETGEKLSSRGQSVFNTIEQSSKPVIAVINGYALGGGAELAMACHIRIATDNALIGLPEVSLGLIPGYGGTQRLPALVGKSKAMEMILTGKPVKAADALSYGLVNHVKDSGEALSFAKQLATTILKNGPIAVAKAIQAINKATEPTGFDAEADLFGQLCETDDFAEGTSAFIDKRKADFKGR